MLPQVHDGRHESLTLEKPLDGDRRLVLRLWPAQVQLNPGALPLWLGLAGEQQQVRVAGLLTYAATSGDFAGALAQLTVDIQPYLQHQSSPDGQILRLRPRPPPPPSARSSDG